MKKRTILATLAAGAVALSMTACGSSTSAGNGGGAASGGATGSGQMQTVKMMVGGIDKQIYLPYKLAEQLGLYKKYGIDMQLSTEQDGGVGAEDAMASGQVDMAGAWYLHTFDFQSKGKDVIDVVQLSGAPGERIMCSPNANVHSGADIKGKKMGVTDLGSGTDTLTQFVAAKAGVKKSDYATVKAGAGATAIAAIKNGLADCVMTTQPTVTAMESKGVAQSAIDLATTDGATAAVGGNWPAASVLAQSSWVKDHESAVQGVVNALVETMQWIKTHSAQEIADKLPADYTANKNITKDDYVKALTQDKGQFLPDGIMPAGGPKTIAAMETQIGMDISKVTVGNTFTNKYALKALDTLGLKPTTTPAGADG
ncbi:MULTISPECIES: ABC transporter substrate-binding protein [Arthrobacter]|uniref:ABC transporter substrate-binding protein n=2 Tax=Arthrobacter TaxID=1663 RepID=A0ABU9KPJ3_9MICC|nr:ABC transporter substrate-binding protein [Arthrobacter sp. YJM1]MDP5228430.1 ABC transporter substrate-binding protein [Arthrobacter sp. YJM1]